MSPDVITVDHNPPAAPPAPARTVKPAAAAIRKLAVAKRKRALADAEVARDPTGTLLDRREAAQLDADAMLALDPATHSYTPLAPGRGGEIVAETREVWAEAPGIVATVRQTPDMLDADAGLERLELASTAGVLTLATDAAESAKAQDSIERMLAHQMAAAHRMAMQFVAEAQAELAAYRATGGRQQHHSVEASRMAATAARLMDGYQKAVQTLDRRRTGGKQHVIVQHIHVSDGGQAVVAGTAQSRARTAGGVSE